MKSQLLDRVPINNGFTMTSVASLIGGYMLNFRCEGRSQATIKDYQYRLRCFLWFCRTNDCPDAPHKIGAHHIR